ncbi:MAG TPA: PAS domain S-box protein [Candidatus Didemnitutus sp.]|nr:PAS domain S-box protein [Candidatus Didemnitutus sp.]
MKWLDDVPVQRKLGFAMMLTTTVALLAACAVFLAAEYLSYRRNLVHTVATLAHISAENSTAAIAFSDRASARQILEALRAEPQITAATLYDAQGRLFARFLLRPDEEVNLGPAAPIGTRIVHGSVIVVEPVIEGNRRLGLLHLQASMSQIYERMGTYALVVLGVIASSFGLAGLVASTLRRSIARPIIELARTAATVSARQDYSIRAEQYGRDELGQLTATVNAMLARTQAAVSELRESEYAHRELVRALPIAVYMCDASGLITLFNAAAVALWGRTPEIGTEYWCGSYRIYDAAGGPLALDQCPMAVTLRESRPVRGIEIIIERPDGSRRHVLPHPEPIRDTSGAMVGVVNMLLDITDEKLAGEAVRRLAAIVESSDDAIISRNLDDIVTTWNRGAEILFGYTAPEIVGRSVELLLPALGAPADLLPYHRARLSERVEHYETLGRRKDGGTVDVSVTVSPIRDASGRVIGASKIARNISERKRAEEQANFLSHLSQILGPLNDPDEVLRQAARAIGEHLQADRCYVFMPIDQGRRAVIREDWARHGLASIRGEYRTEDFGTPELLRAMAAGPLAIDDKVTHPLTRDLGAGYDAIQVAAHATAPFVRDDQWIACLAVTSVKPRQWRADELSRLEHALGRVWPVVERARTQRELRESERRQRELMQSLPVACVTLDAEGWITFFNKSAADLWGRSPELGRTRWTGAYRVIALDGTPLAPEALPVATALRERRSVREVELYVERADGSRRWVRPHPDPIIDAEGRCTGVVNVIMDVTVERTAAQNLRKAADRLNLAIASANLGDWNWDAASDQMVLSERTCEIYGVPRGTALTRTALRQLLYPEDRQRALAALQQSVATGADYDIEYRVNRNGGQCWVSARGRCVRQADGRVAGMVGMVQDITARKQAEIELKRARDEALEASRAKDDFLAALSHELRTPLNPVLLLASDAARNPDLPAAVREDFELVRKNVDLEARLIDDLLDLTRITRGKVQLVQHRCDVRTILEDAIANVRPDLAEKQLRLSVNFHARDSSVLGDAVRLQQAFWNILKNAVKFTPNGGRISVETLESDDGKRLLVRISDTGIGMTPEEIERAFQAFSQGDHAVSGSHLHRFGGLGLGLAITKMLVDLHGGSIRATSEGRDQGAIFTIELPVHHRTGSRPPDLPASNTGAATPATSVNRPVVPGAGRRILLVEDHAPTRKTLQQLLGHRHFDVAVADTAGRARELATSQEFDILISDVGLPDRNGYDLMVELRGLKPNLVGIALSGYGMEEDLAKSRAAGFASHLVKPVTIGMLEEAIAALPDPAAH